MIQQHRGTRSVRIPSEGPDIPATDPEIRGRFPDRVAPRSGDRFPDWISSVVPRSAKSLACAESLGAQYKRAAIPLFFGGDFEGKDLSYLFRELNPSVAVSRCPAPDTLSLIIHCANHHRHPTEEVHI